jgi:phenylalanyl-tRNA synthetase beta chain
MKIVYNWLKEFVEVTAPAAELAARLAVSGTNIGGVENGAHGAVIEAELTTNRPDCLGHYGMAREVSAIYRLPLKAVQPKPSEGAGKVSDAVRVEIQAPELCGRFTARVIRGVKIAPSPAWLRERLEASGMASINNVVDATNYVMLELGHALHAFDYDLVRDHRIVVRKARPGEKMKTLDGVERALNPDLCMVCDGDGARAVGIGGIMGGAETEISFSTKNVLIECAWFEPIAIRRATRFLRLYSEASTRFGRGADPEMAEVASGRCVELILQLAGGELLAGVVDAYPGQRAAKKITLRRSELLRIMGADVADKEIEAILGALGFAPVRVDENRGAAGSLLAAWECTQPSWRAEVEREIDLIEEVARIHGLDKFPPRFPVSRQAARQLPNADAQERLRERLVGLGYHEIVTIPHVAEERNEIFRPAEAVSARLANPLSEEAGVLRSTGAVTMAAAIEWNLNHGQRNARLFEIGRHYRLAGHEAVETLVLALGATGEAREKSIHEAARAYDFSDLKGDVDALGGLAGGLRWEQGGGEWLHAGHRARVLLGAEELGAAGKLARRVAEKLKLRQDVFLAELRLEPFYAAARALGEARRYAALPRFPAVERDFSLLLAEGTAFADVAGAIRELGIREVVAVEAADLFRGGKNVPAGKYSLLVRVQFQSGAGTLTDEQIGGFCGQIVGALEKRLGAVLRAR